MVSTALLLALIWRGAAPEDAAQAKRALDRWKPEILFADTPNPTANGKTFQAGIVGEQARIIIDPEALLLKDGSAFQWSQRASYLEALGLVPRLAALDPKVEPVSTKKAASGTCRIYSDGSRLCRWADEVLASTLLHELIHLDTRAGDKQVDELRARGAEYRMARALEKAGSKRWKKQAHYQAWKKRLDEEPARRSLKAAQEQAEADLKLKDPAIEALGRSRVKKSFEGSLGEYRALLKRLIDAGVLDEGEQARALAHIEKLEAEAYNEADTEAAITPSAFRAAIKKRLEALKRDAGLLDEAVRHDAEWRAVQ